MGWLEQAEYSVLLMDNMQQNELVWMVSMLVNVDKWEKPEK